MKTYHDSEEFGIPISTQSAIKALTLDECLDLINEEIINSEKNLRKQQLKIASRLILNGGKIHAAHMPVEAIIEAANTMAAIARLRLYGMEGLVADITKISMEDWFDIQEFSK